MSYCRFSSLDFTCDLYVYQSVNGWEIHVASNKTDHSVDGLTPLPLVSSADWPSAYVERSKELRRRMDRAERKPLTLPHAGESFTFNTPGEAAAMVRKLVALGYRAPTGLADELEAEGEEA